MKTLVNNTNGIRLVEMFCRVAIVQQAVVSKVLEDHQTHEPDDFPPFVIDANDKHLLTDCSIDDARAYATEHGYAYLVTDGTLTTFIRSFTGAVSVNEYKPGEWEYA